jgi:hypothetical protein
MRKIALAAAAGAVGLLIAAAPASALSTYQIQTDGGANFDGAPNDNSSKSGFSMTTKTSNEDPITGLPVAPRARFGATQNTEQQDLSRDMGWQGTGYYLRPNN